MYSRLYYSRCKIYKKLFLKESTHFFLVQDKFTLQYMHEETPGDV